MEEQNNARGFLGFSPPQGLIPQWREFQKGREKPPLRFSPWFKIHLTLVFWPSLSRLEFESLRNALSSAKIQPPEEIFSEIKGFHFFLRTQVLYLKEKSEAIIEWQQSLTRIIAELNLPFPPEQRDFTPHWTIARKFQPGLLESHRKYFRDLDSFALKGSPGSFSLYYSKNGVYEAYPLYPFPSRKQ